MLHKDLKQLMEDACFACLGKLFQTIASLYEKHFCPFDVFSLVSVYQVSVSRVMGTDGFKRRLAQKTKVL